MLWPLLAQPQQKSLFEGFSELGPNLVPFLIDNPSPETYGEKN